MKISPRVIFGAAALALCSTTVTQAQGVFSNINAAEERNEDLIEAIEDDAERDLDRFGNEGLPEGFSGSFALRSVAASGNTDSLNAGIGADLNYIQGPNGYQLQLNYIYGEDDGTKNEESLYYDFQYTRELTPVWYGYAKLQGSVDEFSAFDSDSFLSAGAGYRVFNEPNRQWSVQAGPGYRIASLSGLSSSDFEEGALGVSSDYAIKLSKTVFLTNDTDIITSSSDTVIFNDLALSVAMTNSLAIRTSILTEHHTDPSAGFKSTDNTFGVALVYSFN